MRIPLYKWLAAGLVLIGAAGLVWSVWPAERISQTQPLPAAAGWSGVVGIDAPAELRIGSDGSIDLSLTNLESRKIPDGSHDLVEVRLEFAELRPQPEGTQSQPLIPGQKLNFQWQLAPQVVGSLSGTLWVAVQRVHAGGQVERIPLLAKPVDVHVQPGLVGGWAPVQALAGLFLAVGMGLGFLPAAVWKRFTAARRR